MTDNGFTIEAQCKPAMFPRSSKVIAPYNNVNLDRLRENIHIKDEYLKINVVRFIILVLNSPTERRKAERTIGQSLVWFRGRFLPYIDQLRCNNDVNEDLEVFISDYFDWLNSISDHGNQIARDWNFFHTLICKGCSDKANKPFINAQAVNLKNQSRLKVEYGTKKTLSQLYPSLDLDNDLELIIGCQEVTLWFLNEMNSIRQAVKDSYTHTMDAYYERVLVEKRNYADRYANFRIGITSEKITSRDGKQKTLTPDFMELTELIKIIHSIRNNVADEIMFAHLVGIRAFLEYFIDKPQSFSLQEMREFVSDFWHGDERRAPRELQGERPKLKVQYAGPIKELHHKGLAQTIFPSLSFPLMPTQEEKIAMQWLLASARSQTSGIASLTVEKNVIIDKEKKTIQLVQERKNRRGKSGAGHDSPIYKNDNNYFIMTQWVDLITEAKNYIADLDDKFIPNISNHSSSTSYRKSDYSFWLMASEGTITNKQIRKDFTGNKNESSVLAFLKLMRKNLEESRKSVDRHSKQKYQNQINRATGISVKRAKNKSQKARICISIIAQTRAVINGNAGHYQLLGHTEATHKNTYINRTSSHYVNSDSATWAADVGNSFISEAKKLYAGTEFLTVSQAKKVLQLKDITGSDDLEFVQHMIDQAENDGYIIELSSILKSNEMSIVVMTPWTCALIKAHANHLAQQINEVKVSTAEKLLRLKVQQLYLTLLLERFSKKMIKKADKILSEYTIPFARAL